MTVVNPYRAQKVNMKRSSSRRPSFAKKLSELKSNASTNITPINVHDGSDGHGQPPRPRMTMPLGRRGRMGREVEQSPGYSRPSQSSVEVEDWVEHLLAGKLPPRSGQKADHQSRYLRPGVPSAQTSPETPQSIFDYPSEPYTIHQPATIPLASSPTGPAQLRRDDHFVAGAGTPRDPWHHARPISDSSASWRGYANSPARANSYTIAQPSSSSLPPFTNDWREDFRPEATSTPLSQHTPIQQALHNHPPTYHSPVVLSIPRNSYIEPFYPRPGSHPPARAVDDDRFLYHPARQLVSPARTTSSMASQYTPTRPLQGPQPFVPTSRTVMTGHKPSAGLSFEQSSRTSDTMSGAWLEPPQTVSRSYAPSPAGRAAARHSTDGLWNPFDPSSHKDPDQASLDSWSGLRPHRSSPSVPPSLAEAHRDILTYRSSTAHTSDRQSRHTGTSTFESDWDISGGELELEPDGQAVGGSCEAGHTSDRLGALSDELNLRSIDEADDWTEHSNYPRQVEYDESSDQGSYSYYSPSEDSAPRTRLTDAAFHLQVPIEVEQRARAEREIQERVLPIPRRMDGRFAPRRKTIPATLTPDHVDIASLSSTPTLDERRATYRESVEAIEQFSEEEQDGGEVTYPSTEIDTNQQQHRTLFPILEEDEEKMDEGFFADGGEVEFQVWRDLYARPRRL